MSQFPLHQKGVILGFTNEEEMPNKMLDMGILPHVVFRILFQAPFNGPLYIEFGEENTKIALRTEEANYILVSPK